MPNQPKTPIQRFRMDPIEWDEFGSDAAFVGRDRSSVIRELIAWWMRKPGAKVPTRPSSP